MTSQRGRSGQATPRGRFDKPTDPFYRTKAWRLIREEALARDNHLCQRCLTLDLLTKANTVHHLEPLADKPERALDIDNLQSLCACCHNAVHDAKPQAGRKEERCKARVVRT